MSENIGMEKLIHNNLQQQGPRVAIGFQKLKWATVTLKLIKDIKCS